MAKRLFVVVAGTLALASISVFAQAKHEAHMLMGTWKLNVEKSRFSPGPGPKSQTLKWEPSGSGFVFTIDTVNAQGQAVQSGARGMVGKSYPAKTANGTVNRLSTRVDDFTFEETDTVDGKVQSSRRAVVSKDGKLLTVTGKGINAQGQPTNNVTVYEKQ